jgi:hypothetical protein
MNAQTFSIPHLNNFGGRLQMGRKPPKTPKTGAKFYTRKSKNQEKVFLANILA